LQKKKTKEKMILTVESFFLLLQNAILVKAKSLFCVEKRLLYSILKLNVPPIINSSHD
jgi:hypothetical protein